MTAVLAFSLAGAVTFGLRSSMTIVERSATSPRLGSWIALVSPAVLTAIIASALLVDHDEIVWPRIGETLAIASAVCAVRKTGNMSLALAVGLPVYWLAGALGMA